MQRATNKDALDVVTNILDATDTNIGPQKAAINTLKRRGWTDEKINECLERYKVESPRLDWVSHPIDREAIRTAAGDETETVKAYLQTVGANRKRQTSGFARKSGSRQKGADNREQIKQAKDEILSSWPSNKKPPSSRSLAMKIETKTGIPMETVRGHLKKMG